MMFKNTFFPITMAIVLMLISCGNISKQEVGSTTLEAGSEKIEDERPLTTKKGLKSEDWQLNTIVTGANQTEKYLHLLKGKRVGIVGNQTSLIFGVPKGQSQEPKLYTHLVDSLLSLEISIIAVFAPEHGFRGTADAGEHIKNGRDKTTGIPIISLYGDAKKPKLQRLSETKKVEDDLGTGATAIDIIVFDLQDVGARFYTYISTLHYVMEACAQANVPLLILDRPNPNGHYIDGPVLEKEHSSFVGMHPIPIVHGMTIGEYAQMINGEKWLKDGVQCQLNIIPIKNYTHQTHYSLPIKPSPNLPNDTAINLYPSLCFFEGTNVSVGRGTSKQFQVFGSPSLNKAIYSYTFIPQPNVGAKYPPHQSKTCYGKDLSSQNTLNTLNLEWLIKAYSNSADQSKFFNNFFTNLAGTRNLQKQIEKGMSETAIKNSWTEGLNAFKMTRKKYTIYKD